MKYPKKLIEVALPLEAISQASAREKSIRHGHPSTLHLWWSRKPLAAARAVLFAQMVDDPSARPELFPTEEDQEKERKRLFGIIEELVKWENTTNEVVLEKARKEIWESWKRTCADNADHPQAAELFNPNKLPAFHDPFAGGGSIPLEAQRLGLEACASDLNPVAVLINKAMIEIPPKFAGKQPVNLESRSKKDLIERQWKGAMGLAEDVRYYGKWMRDEAEKRIGHLYPKIKITDDMVAERPDLVDYRGRELTVIAWIWVRTVKSPNPAFSHVDVPLTSKFILSSKSGHEAYAEPIIERDGYRFKVKVGRPADFEKVKNGTSAGKRNAFVCLMSGVPINYDYIRQEGKAGKMGSRLLAIVVEGDRGRVYLSPDALHEEIARQAKPTWIPDIDFPFNPRDFKTPNYGLNTFGDLFTPRQLVALDTFSYLVQGAIEKIRIDALAAGMKDDDIGLDAGGLGAKAYAQAVAFYLGISISRISHYWSNITCWHSGGEKLQCIFARQAIPMVWDYAEGNPFSNSSGNWIGSIEWICEALIPFHGKPGHVVQQDAQKQQLSSNKIISTDPPYFDNISYADLSDFFYVWLKKSLKEIYPSLFDTITTPKGQELIVTPYRHNGKEKSTNFFLNGMTESMSAILSQSHPAFPVTIYYAFKQSELISEGTSSTGWEIFLEAVLKSGFTITGTWPIRTEMKSRSLTRAGNNALASSIVLVCRKRDSNAPATTRKQFIAELKAELPKALAELQKSSIAPVDLAQASIGPGMAIYTRFSSVLDAEGKPLTVRQALALINQVLDETLAEQEGDFDSDTRFAIAWFDQYGFSEGEFGAADVLARAKDTSVAGMAEAGFLYSRQGKVRLLKPTELPADWNPSMDTRISDWEIVHQLIRTLESGGEIAAADLVRQLGTKAEQARELAYRLYNLCERKKRPQEALSYNSLVQSWSEIVRLSKEFTSASKPGEFFFG